MTRRVHHYADRDKPGMTMCGIPMPPSPVPFGQKAGDIPHFCERCEELRRARRER